MSKMLLIVFAINISLFIALGVEGLPGNELYNFLINPFNWEGSSLMKVLVSLTVLGAGVIAVGAVFGKTDLIVFGALAATLLTFGMPLSRLFIEISLGTGSKIPAMLFVSPIILIYIFTVILWWRGGTQG